MELYSVKMRASQREAGRERHISGAEKIVREERLEKVVSQLLERALHHAKGRADFVNLKVEAVSPEEVTHLEALPVTTCPVDTVEEGRDQLRKLLAQAGIDHGEAILGQMEAAYGMRGAMLLHVDTLQHLEPRPTPGDPSNLHGCGTGWRDRAGEKPLPGGAGAGHQGGQPKQYSWGAVYLR